MPSFWDKLQVDGQDMSLYASIPGGSGPFPAVVVIQAAGGVNDFITKVSDSLAKEGYVAVAPDLFPSHHRPFRYGRDHQSRTAQ